MSMGSEDFEHTAAEAERMHRTHSPSSFLSCLRFETAIEEARVMCMLSTIVLV